MSNTNSLLKISYWARENRWKARMLIIMGLIALTNIAIFWGELLHEEGVYVPTSILYGSAIVFLAFVISYPMSSRKEFFLRRKLSDLVLLLTTCLMITAQSNHFASNTPFASALGTQSVAYAWVPKKVEQKTSNNLVNKSKAEIRSLKKAVISELKVNKNYSDGEKVVLTILSVLGAAALLVLLAGAVCNLSCSGAEGAAALVAILGVGAVIFLFVILMKRIHGKNKTSTTSGGSTETE